MEPSDPKPTEAQQRIKTQNGKKSDQADRVGVDLASSKRGSIAQPLPNRTGLSRWFAMRKSDPSDRIGQ